MRVVFVIDDVFKVNARLGEQILEEALVEDEGHSADLLHLRLVGRVPVDEIGRDGDRQFAAKLLPPEA